MGFLNKLGLGVNIPSTRSFPQNAERPSAGHQVAATGSPRAPQMNETTRISNGLKEFLRNLDGLGRGKLLDLGPAWQTTLSFFIERGFRVSSEDILRAWKDFLVEEERHLKSAVEPSDSIDLTPAGRAQRFLESNLQYPAASFDAVLMWDLLDYLEPVLAKQTVAAITELVRPGGVVLTMFHSKKPEGFQRYRVLDNSSLQILSSPVICPAQKVYQNREIQDLFSRYRTYTSFVSRDQLRENLYIK